MREITPQCKELKIAREARPAHRSHDRSAHIILNHRCIRFNKASLRIIKGEVIVFGLVEDGSLLIIPRDSGFQIRVISKESVEGIINDTALTTLLRSHVGSICENTKLKLRLQGDYIQATL